MNQPALRNLNNLSRQALLLTLFALTVLPAEAARADEPAAGKPVSVAPAEFTLRGVRGKQQLVVTATLDNRRQADLTHRATYESSDPKVAEVSASGQVLARGDGTATITVRVEQGAAEARVTVAGMSEPSQVDFHTGVIAALSRAGCSQGACHGSPQGKNGFRLSLRGFDPEVDAQTLTREGASRRTNSIRPEESLLLLKGAGRVPHGGGVRFKTTDVSYRTLLDWISEGCTTPQQERKLVSLEVIPGKRRLHADSPRQQLLALAHFEDGSTEDVSSLAVFTTGRDPAVTVSPDGLVEFTGTAEVSILVRYLQQVRSVQLTYLREDAAYSFQGPEPANFVDRHVFAKQQSLQLQPAALAADSVFLRRVYLDTIGAMPTLDETRAFLDSQAPDKRERLIDSLLDRDEFASFWAMKWADVMRGNRNTISVRGVHSWRRYLVNAFADDRPFDQTAREIVTSLGNTLDRPAANFYRISPVPDEAAESFAQLFLGVRMQCAKCHNHPFEAITQGDYYGLAAYFARVKIKGKQFALDDEIVFLARQGEVQHPLTKKNLEPAAFGVPAGKLEPDEDRRRKLADWLTSPENKLFARSTVNRVWYHLLAKGIVEPVDDFRDTNPPSNPELLDALAEEFVRGGYRFKPVIRAILNSRTYQLSAASDKPQSPYACDPGRYFTQSSVRMLTAEQALDAISSAIGIPEVYPGYPVGARAIELAEGAVDNHFLMAFSRPIRDAACDCAREEEPSLNQVIHLLNNEDLVKKIASPDSRLGHLLSGNKSTPEIVEAMYLAALTRRPTETEKKLVDDHIGALGDRVTALQDLQHALLNCNEFLLRH